MDEGRLCQYCDWRLNDDGTCPECDSVPQWDKAFGMPYDAGSAPADTPASDESDDAAALRAENARLRRQRDGLLLYAHRVLEGIFVFPVNASAQVYVRGCDAILERQQLSLWGDNADDVLRLKSLVEELESEDASR